MMPMSLLDLISQNQPHFQTHKALLVIGLQNDFVSPDGKLPADTRTGFLDRIETVIPKFRQLSANVIWVQTVYEADRAVNDPASDGDMVLVGQLDGGVEESTDDEDEISRDLIPPSAPTRSSRRRALELLKRVSARKKTAAPRTASPSPAEEEELFLSRASRRGPSCVPGTPGAEFVERFRCKIEPTDAVVKTSHYSAFLGTQLLLILRAKLVTELYICGCITNLSVFATVVDAARHGIKIYVVEDCLGYRKQNRHDEAMKRMVDYIEAINISSAEILKKSCSPEEPAPQPSSQSRYDTKELEDLVEKLALKNDTGSSHGPSSKPPSIAVNGRHRTLSDASVAESRATTDTGLSDEQFMEKLTQGARLSTDSQNRPSAPKPHLVKSKIRMRSRSDKSKKDDEKKPKGDAGKKAEASKKTEQKAESVNRAESSPQSASNNSVAMPPKPAKSPSPASEAVPRKTTISKAESSDRLREKMPSKSQQKLKGSASQPALSAQSIEKGKSSAQDSNSKGASPSQVTNDKSKPPSKLSISSTPPSSKTESPPKEISKPPQTPSSKPPPVPPTSEPKPSSHANLPMLGPNDRIGEGDSRIIHDFFAADYRHPTDPSKPFKDVIFYQLYNEVRWQRMFHATGEVPRLVCCQGEFGVDGSMPVYRHPADQALPLLHFSPKVQVIRKQAEKLAGHPLNHVLIQLYRSGHDYISEHSDKTLDIVRGSTIINVSFGAQRLMRLRTKKSAQRGESPSSSDEKSTPASRQSQRIAMPNNSMFILGQKTNMRWLHGIQQDKRLPANRGDAEKAYSGMRISLTFRHIGTFLDHKSSRIWGQGATSKEKDDANDVINDDEEENVTIIRAFGKENMETEFDWDAHYGAGFDVLHFREPPEDLPILFASNNHVETRMIRLFLEEAKIKHILLEPPVNDGAYELDRQVTFRDTDINHTEISIAVPILLYLDRYYPLDVDDRGRACNAESYSIFITVSGMLKFWVNRAVPTYYNDFVNTLMALEERVKLSEGPFIAGRRFSIGDCAAWCAVDEIVRAWEEWDVKRFEGLARYWAFVKQKKRSVKKIGEGSGEGGMREGESTKAKGKEPVGRD